jgi:hypothetical protein
MPLADIEALCAGFVVVLHTPADQYRRRVYLSLHSAEKALARAQARGQRCWLVLCELRPVGADLELGGEVL